MITMLLGGLWHGASWNFVIWGFLHGLFLGIERLLKFPTYIASKSAIVKAFSGLICFNLVCFAWVFFRAETLSKSIGILSRIFEIDFFLNLKITDSNIFISIIFNIIIFFCLEKLVKNISNKTLKISFIHTALIILIVLFGVNEGSQFIYFQF